MLTVFAIGPGTNSSSLYSKCIVQDIIAIGVCYTSLTCTYLYNLHIAVILVWHENIRLIMLFRKLFTSAASCLLGPITENYEAVAAEWQ